MDAAFNLITGEIYKGGVSAGSDRTCTRFLQNALRLTAAAVMAVATVVLVRNGGGLLLQAAEKGVYPLVIGGVSAIVGVCTFPFGLVVAVPGLVIAGILGMPSIIVATGSAIVLGTACLTGFHTARALANIK